MNFKKIVCHLFMLMSSVVFIMPVYADENINTIVDGLIRRQKAIQTATVRYKYGSLWAYPGQPKPWGWDGRDQREVFLTIAGNEWATYEPGSTSKRVHQNDQDAAYSYIDQPDGTTIHSLFVKGSEDTLGSQQQMDQRFRIFQAGTIPWLDMMDYLDQNRDKAVYRGKVSVEGEETHLLEWVIPRKDYNILHAYNPILSSKYKSALLMAYVIPQKGYVVRRLDYCTPHGVMANRHEANHFQEVAEGIYFPWEYYYIRNFYDYGNHKGYYTDRCSLIKISDVNQPISESVFDIKMPKGTYVGDYRPGKVPVNFQVGETFALSDIDDIIAKHVSSQTNALNRSGKWRAILLVGNIIIVLCLALAILLRRLHFSKTHNTRNHMKNM